MTREFKEGERVVVTQKSDTDDLWVPEMDEYIGQEFTVGYVYSTTILMDGLGWFFPKDSLRLVDDLEEIPLSPVSQKTVFTREGSGETYDTERDALIDHFDEAIRPLVTHRGQFNIQTVLGNRRLIIELLQRTECLISNVEEFV